MNFRRVFSYIASYSTLALLVLGALIISNATINPVFALVENTNSEADYNDELIRCAVSGLFGFIEGAFGALIMVIAGILAIISAAMGGYRTAVSLLVVAVGAFILRSLVSLFFGVDFPECTF